MNFALSMISDNPTTIQQASGFLPDGVNSMNQFVRVFGYSLKIGDFGYLLL